MIPRPIAMTGLLGAAVGVPYAISNAPDNWGPNTSNAPPAPQSQQQAVDPALLGPPKIVDPSGPGSELYVSPAPLEGRRQLPLSDLLNWNITKDWVYQGWARKSTGLADPQLFGVRVPVVTGSAMTDVAGALSYYFDNAGRLQKIRLHGRTADTTELVRLAMTRFGMRPKMASIAGEQQYEAAERNQVRSELRTRAEGVLWSTSPHGSFTVDLEVNRPGSNFWVVRQPPQLQLAGQEAPVEVDPQTKPESKPILPHNSVVPDATSETAAAPTEGAKVEAKTVSAKPDSNIAPLQSYRDRFRWPD